MDRDFRQFSSCAPKLSDNSTTTITLESSGVALPYSAISPLSLLVWERYFHWTPTNSIQIKEFGE